MTKERRLTEAARQLRQRETGAEAILWFALRARQLAGLKFRRQHPAGPFVLDFYCRERKLVVELDGAIHEAQAEQDRARTEILQQYGYRVIRFRNDEVENDLTVVLAKIRAFAEQQ